VQVANRRMLGAMAAIVIIVAAGTTAYAAVRVAPVRPEASDLPVMRTTRPVELAPASAVATLPQTAGPASAHRTGTPSGTTPTSRPSTPRPAASSGSPEKKKVKSSDDDREVITAPLHDSDESEHHGSEGDIKKSHSKHD
jgi:hypothetical protein